MNAKRILVVGDDVVIDEALAASLYEEGYKAESAYIACEQADMVIDSGVEIVILNYGIAEFTGIDLLKQLQTIAGRTAIFVITGMPEIKQVLEDEGLARSVRGIIQKPYILEELVEQLRRV